MTATSSRRKVSNSTEVEIKLGSLMVHGDLQVPQNAAGIVLFAHGSGSSRHSPRNQYVARVIRDSGIATLLFDLLTPQEEAIDNYTRHLRFDINLLARRLVDVTKWVEEQGQTRNLRAGYFGASTGAAAALVKPSVRAITFKLDCRTSSMQSCILMKRAQLSR